MVVKSSISSGDTRDMGDRGAPQGRSWKVGGPQDSRPVSRQPQRSQSDFMDANYNVSQSRRVDPSAVAAMRAEAQQHSEVSEYEMNQNARKRVEMITGIGRCTKDVQVGENTFTLRTLKGYEQNSLNHVQQNGETVTYPNGMVGFNQTSMYDIRVEALTYAISMIDYQQVETILGCHNWLLDEQLAAKKELVMEMDSALTEHLYTEYRELQSSTVDGYAPKSAEETKEVVEDIRKSGQD